MMTTPDDLATPKPEPKKWLRISKKATQNGKINIY